VWLTLAGPQHLVGAVHPGLPGFSADFDALVIPTSLQRVAPGSIQSVGDSLGPGVEHGAYVGFALLALLVVLVLRFRHHPVVRFAAWMGAASLVLSLGSRLAIDNHPSVVPLPFAVLGRLPLLDDLVPERFGLFVMLFAGLIVAVGLGQLHATGPSTSATATLALLMVALVSLVPAWPEAVSPTAVPAFFRSPAVASVPSGSVALVYPIADDAQDDAMLWQAESGLRFKMIDGYVSVPGPGGVGEVPWLNSLTDILLEECRVGDRLPPLTPRLLATVRAELAQDRVATVIIAPVGHSPGLARHLMTVVLGRPPAQVGGVAVWRHVGGTDRGPPTRPAA